MATAGSGRGRAYRLTPVVLVAGLLAAGCTTAVAGKGIPDGEEAARYVSGKFEQKLKSLSDAFSGRGSHKVRLDWHGRIDDKDADLTVITMKVGSPPARYIKEKSNQQPEKSLKTYHPVGSKVQYMLLGPFYSSLAPTPWVSMPYDKWSRTLCARQSYRTFCKMVNAIAMAAEEQDAAKKATTLPGGGVELSATVSLRDFLDKKIIDFPEKLLEVVSEPMLNERVPATIRFGPNGHLNSVAMNAIISKGGHEVEIHVKFEVLGKPSKGDLPEVPPADQVTKLEDKAAVEDFYDRMGNL